MVNDIVHSLKARFTNHFTSFLWPKDCSVLVQAVLIILALLWLNICSPDGICASQSYSGITQVRRSHIGSDSLVCAQFAGC